MTDTKTDVDATKAAKDARRADRSVTRRQVLGGIGIAGVAAVAGGAVTSAFVGNETARVTGRASDGYLLIDTRKCAGCRSCMSACALAHHGVASLSLARIQVQSDPFAAFPDDAAQAQCHQCPYPSCVAACPVGAMHIDAKTGVRTVDVNRCIGCERCINACPFTPSRVQWNPVEKHAQKCDLCLDTPYWDHEGGPAGEQACVKVCPMKAISFTSDIPVQGDAGYEVNLRNQHFTTLGFPTDDEGKEVPAGTYTARHAYTVAQAAGLTAPQS